MLPIRDDGRPLQKHIYDFLSTDSSVEKAFARVLEAARKGRCRD